jgi:surface polysaccharide O-acyltransferase-like enzyme
MVKKARKFELSLMNILFCLCVVFIHASSYLITTADRNSWQAALLLPFWKNSAVAVYGFIFLGGVKLAFSLDKPFSYSQYLLGRLKRVLLPYVAAFLIYYLYFYFCGYFEFDLIFMFKNLASGDLVGHFYFIIAIMQFYLLAPIWRYIAKRLDSAERIIAVLIISLFIGQLFGQYLTDFLYIFNKNRVFVYSDRIFTTYMFYWVAGLVVGKYYERIKTAAVANFSQLLILYSFAFSLNAFLAYLNYIGRDNIYWLETSHRFYVISSIMFIFSASIKASPHLSQIKLLHYIDRTSFSIYLWHPLALFVSELIVSKIGGLSLSMIFGIRILFGYFVTIPICILVSLAVEKISKYKNAPAKV